MNSIHLPQAKQSKMSFIKNLPVFITRIHRDDANEDYIKSVFYEQEIAHVRRVDFTKRRDKSDGGHVYYQAKVYFHYWFKNQIAYNLQQRILTPGNYGGRVVYADPWYWIVLKNNNPMTEMELCVNERLEEMEKNMKRVKRQVSELQTDVTTLKEKEKAHKSNTHIKYYYFEEPAVSANVNVAQMKRLACDAPAGDTAAAYEIISDTEAEQTATVCAEAVLEERSTTPEWEEQARVCYGCSLLAAGSGGENQLQHECLGLW
jgi:hypothetical protein